MRRRLRALILAPLVILGASGMTSECQSQTPTPKACDIELHEPIVSPDHPESIEALARSHCDKAPLDHIVHLYIEEELPGGVWFPVVSADRLEWTECYDIPAPGADTLCVRLVECLPGHYRTRATITGAGDSGPFGFNPPEMPDAQIECP